MTQTHSRRSGRDIGREEVDLVTSKGEGVWANQKYQVALKTRVRTDHASLRKSEKHVSRYLFIFASPRISDLRFFPSQERRRLFMAESFTELISEEVPQEARRWTS
jgi:hypothetical protein